jgi:serine/threonine protein kinase/tetratricopeptide (TPR) repeat protein
MIGKQLSHFRIVEKIGEGGMGIVYRAEDRKLGRHVALKVMRPEFVANEERRQRFIREARTAASVTHPNIVTVHEIGEVDGVTFIAMELLDGRGLGAHLGGRAMAPDEAIRIAVDVADGLARAHAAGVIHRDLKPDNVVIGSNGQVTILDFGLAKLHDDAHAAVPGGDTDIQTVSLNATRDGRILGTAAYMSPEQARGLPLDTRSDVFSFGVLLYEMVTGRAPFSGATITDTLSAILRDRQAPIATLNPDVPAELERILNRCLEKKPEDRYENTEHLAADLRSLKRVTDSNSQPLPRVSLSGDVPRPRPSFWLRPKVLAFAAAALVALALILPRLFSAPGGPADRASVAVLPFTNMQDGDDPDRFGQILQELIITDLSGMPTMNVYSSQRLFDIQKRLGRTEARTIDRDMASQVAQEAGAGTMLTGSVSRLGDKWILTSQLVDVAQGTVVGSERIDGADLYVMVDDLTRRIRNNLGHDDALAAAGDMAVRDRTSSSIEAYQTFLRGNELLEDLKFGEAVAAFREAVTVDPAFGQAYYKMAIASWWDRGMEDKKAATDEDAPSRILSTLLTGNLKLTEKDRALAQAVLPLVEWRYEDAHTLYEDLVRRYPDEKEAWYGLGEVLRHRPGGGPDLETLKAFEKAIDLDPGFRLAYFHASEIYVAEGLFDQGVARLKRLLELYPDDPVWRARYAALVVRKGDDAEAEAVISESLERASSAEEQRELLATLAEAQFGRGALDEGVALIERGIAIESDEPPKRLLNQLAMAHRFAQRFADAEKIYGDLLETDPSDQEAFRGLLQVYDDQRRYAEALTLIRGAIDAEPKGIHYRSWIEVAAKRGDRIELERAIDAGLKHGPKDEYKDQVKLDLLGAAERSFRELGDYVQAEEFARRALAGQPKARNHGRLGWSLIRLGRYDEAKESFKRGLALDAKDVESLRGMVRLCLRDRHFDLAVQEGEICAKSVPGRGELTLLEAYTVSGRLEEADKLVDKGLLRIPALTQRIEMLEGVAEVFMLAGEFDRALDRIRQAESLLPGLPMPMLAALRVWALTKLDRIDEATTVLRQALQTSPRHWLLNIEDAGIHLAEGDPAGAEQIARGILKTGPAHSEVFALLATALAEQGRHKQGLEFARRQAAMNPGRTGKTLLAWVLIDGDLDVEEGIRLAEEARELPTGLGHATLTLPYHASPEHCLGLAYLKRGDHVKAAGFLQEAAELRPDRPSIDEHLRQAVARRASLTRRRN